MNFAGTEITDDYVREIYAWLDDLPLSRPKRNVARDFSDGVLMAEILKRYYPKFVNLHNYIPGNSILKKIDNWCTLNRKVFSKLNLKLSSDTINELANSKAGTIEKVLFEIRSKILRDCNADLTSLCKSEESGGEDFIKVATNPEESLNQTVPRNLFVKQKKELEEKKQAVSILLKKVEHLETMLRFKEQRIEDLTNQLHSVCKT